jgi:Secretion system C-terminal sorting domain
VSAAPSETPAGGLEAMTYPNPFNTTTTVEFKNLDATSKGTVEIYSLDGRKVAELYNGNVEADKTYQLKWDAQDVPDGTYMYRIVCGENVATGRMILMRQ